MKINLVARAVGISLASTLLLAHSSVFAADEEQEEAKEKEKENKMTVTGSRIKRVDAAGVSPITVISAKDIIRQGHANVYEAILGLTANTGGVLDEQTTNSFTAAAQAVNLRGFGPGRTLVLLNGNRLPTNPKPYGGVDNFVNLALIPTSAVERVEYLSSGGSAIYGSDAIAGVINIVLRKDYEGNQASVRYTDTKDGGGETYRFNLMGGISDDKYSLMWGFEFDKRTALFGKDRDWLDEATDSPAENPSLVNARDILVAYPWGRWNADANEWLPNWSYQDPGAAACDATPVFEYSNRPDRGNFCGHDASADSALRAPRERINAFAHYSYQINPDHELFASVLAWKSEADAELFYTGWGQQFSVVDDITAADPTWLYDVYYQRIFLPEEVPNEQMFDEDALVVNFGLEGALTDSLDYKLVLSVNDYDYKESLARFTAQGVLSTFLGINANDSNRNRLLDNWGTYLLQPSDLQADGFTPANGLSLYNYFNNNELDGAYGFSTAKGNSYARSISFEVSGEAGSTNAGPIEFAAVAEFNEQGYSLDIDSTTDNGEYIWWSGVGGRGDRSHLALGGEFLVPLSDTLEATIAARYDDYQDDSNVGGAPTYQVGLSWRPNDSFLLRSSYGTTFRAPDLHRLFADNNQFFGTTLDYYTCMTENNATAAQATELFNQCRTDGDSISTRQNTQGDLDLEEETGYSANIGMVWEPIEDFSIQLDMYQTRIEDMVTTLGSDTYSQLEAECRLGFDIDGESVDSNSAYCNELYSRIVRLSGPGNTTIDPINEVFLSSINMGLQEITGLDSSFSYALETDSWGRFNFRFDYSYIEQVKTQVLKTDEIDKDVLETSWYSFPYKTRGALTTSWTYDDFISTLYVSRIGSTRNWDGDGRTPGYTTANLYFSYQFNDQLSASLNIVNLTDERPPTEGEWEDWPYFNTYPYYNGAIGTEYFMTVNYQF